jgi:Tfp pilus assembly pilus retraction ATPase PilT
MIREGKTPQITSAIQTGVKEGMIDMDSSIRKLYDEKKISARAASTRRSTRPSSRT